MNGILLLKKTLQLILILFNKLYMEKYLLNKTNMILIIKHNMDGQLL